MAHWARPSLRLPRSPAFLRSLWARRLAAFCRSSLCWCRSGWYGPTPERGGGRKLLVGWPIRGSKGIKEIWPGIAVAVITLAIPQFLISNFHGPWLTDIGAAIISMVCLILFLKVWRPKTIWGLEGH